MADTRERDAVSGTETTGHVWDGIRELNTPLPRWWLWTLWATVIWSLAYWIAMPAWPLVSDYTRGILGYSQRQAVADDIAEARRAQARFREEIRRKPLAEIRSNPELLTFAMAGGRSAFAVNCSQCHGTGAAGGPGYPNLNDDDWLWGGSLDSIHTTILHGVRSGHDDSLENDMPAFLADEMLTRAEIDAVAEFVISLSGAAKSPPLAKQGGVLYAEQCATCHREDGKGDPELGAPDLTDAIWLYGGTREDIVEVVSYSRRGVMPAWDGRLDPVTIKQLAVYVHSLGGGE